jgi:general secretion pathway protein A
VRPITVLMSRSLVPTPDVLDLREGGRRAIEMFEEEAPTATSWTEDASAAGDAGTLTYERYYNLREKPFSLSTDPRFFYRGGVHAPVLHSLAAAIRRREGLIVLTGDIGLGKTTLCRAVLSQLDRKTFATFVPDPFMTREDLLKSMLIDFGVMSVEDLVKGRLKGASRPDLSYPLYEFLQALAPIEAFAVLVIDEVQNLSLPLLEEIRILSDLEAAGRKLLQVMLVGQPEFDEQLALPRLRQVRQRISVRCELGPLDRDGLDGYVSHRLELAGGSLGQVRLTHEALDVVHLASGGVPRLINLICDRALAHGQSARTSRIGPDLVRRGLADLRLPGPPGAGAEAAPAVPPTAATDAAVPSAAAEKELLEAKAGPSPPHRSREGTADLSAVLDQPGSRRPSRPPSLARGKVWSGGDRLRPAAATALMILGVTTGISVAGYWLWMRPLLAGSTNLPRVARPAPAMAAAAPLVAATSADAPITRQASANQDLWVIQTALFSSVQRAAAAVSQLTALGYPAFQSEQTFVARGTFRVAFAGPYASREQAETALVALSRVPGYEGALVRELPPAR